MGRLLTAFLVAVALLPWGGSASGHVASDEVALSEDSLLLLGKWERSTSNSRSWMSFTAQGRFDHYHRYWAKSAGCACTMGFGAYEVTSREVWIHGKAKFAILQIGKDKLVTKELESGAVQVWRKKTKP